MNAETPHKNKGRSKYICPENLRFLINRGNLIISSEGSFDRAMKIINFIKIDKDLSVNTNDEIVDSLRKVIRELPNSVKDFLGQRLKHFEILVNPERFDEVVDADTIDFFKEMIWKPVGVAVSIITLLELGRIKEFLTYFVGVGKQIDLYKGNSIEIIQNINADFGISRDSYEIIELFGNQLSQSTIDLIVMENKRNSDFAGIIWANFDQNGVLTLEIAPLLESINGVNLNRLRTCEVCQSFFWADRKDAFACSKKHSKVRQMRLLRQNWKEKGKLYLKARKKNKEKKDNGTL